MEYPSLFRQECFLLETGLPYEKALFRQGYEDQHTHCLPAGAFLHSGRLQQHRPSFGSGGLKRGTRHTCGLLGILIRVYKQAQGRGSCRVKGIRKKTQCHSKESKQGEGQVRAFSTMAPPMLGAKTQKPERKGMDKGGCNTHPPHLRIGLF